MSDHEEHHSLQSDRDESRRWLDSPANVKKVIRWFFISCGVMALLDVVFWKHLFVHKHTSFPFENIPFFYCLYGLSACVILVILAKGLRKILMRDEDYYDR
jgi:hypothetical protein